MSRTLEELWGQGRRTRVVKLKRQEGRVVQGCDVYIGRECRMGGWDFPQSKWHNPFPVKSGRTPAQAVALFEAYLLKQPELLASLEELRGQVLGCWCKMKPTDPCHGDVLVRFLHAPPLVLPPPRTSPRMRVDSIKPIPKGGTIELVPFEPSPPPPLLPPLTEIYKCVFCDRPLLVEDTYFVTCEKCKNIEEFCVLCILHHKKRWKKCVPCH